MTRPAHPAPSRDDQLVVLYDGGCGFCRVVLAVLLRWDRAHRLDPVPIQSPRGGALLAEVACEDRLESWHAIDAHGVRHSAGAGVPVVFGALAGGRPIARLASRSPWATASAYDWVASRRMSLGRLLNARTRAWAVRVIAERGRMPAIAPRRAPVAEPEPHRARPVAESFGADAERYERARPAYPEAMVKRIVAASPGPNVLDVGCGTGIAARQFRAAGCQVLGVDVDARMADLAGRSGLDVEVAAFEVWEPAGRAFDAVVSGQSWHWVDPVAGAAKAAQALRPGGRLAVFWNVFEPPPDLGEGFSEVYRRVLPDSPFSRGAVGGLQGYSVLFAKAAEGIRAAGAFSDPEQWRFDWERSYTRDEWLDQVPTFGGHSQFPPATLGELLAGIGAAIDAAGGSFTMDYTAAVVTAARTV